MRKLYYFAFFLVLYEFTVYSANDIIMPGMPKVVADFHAPLSYVGASFSLYMLGECAVQLWLGPLAERYGKRQAILWGNFSFLLFTIVIVSSTNIRQFMWGRWLQGSGMAFIAMGYALIHEKFNDKDAVKLIALMSNVSILAPLIGPLIGGIIVSYVNWRYIFALTSLLGLASLAGLYRYAPASQAKMTHFNLKQILTHYIEIAVSKNFALGVTCTITGAMPLLIWLGLAPNILLHHLHLSYKSYIIYQIVTIGGLSVSGVLTHFLAGKLSFYQLIRLGCYVSFSGILISFCGSSYIHIVAFGLFFYSLGFGLSNGSIMRIILSHKTHSQSMAASLMTFNFTLFSAAGLELSNYICGKFNYSSLSFTACCLPVALCTVFFMTKFSNNNRQRAWEE